MFANNAAAERHVKETMDWTCIDCQGLATELRKGRKRMRSMEMCTSDQTCIDLTGDDVPLQTSQQSSDVSACVHMPVLYKRAIDNVLGSATGQDPRTIPDIMPIFD